MLLDGDRLIDVTLTDPGLAGGVAGLLAGGREVVDRLQAMLADPAAVRIPFEPERLGPCVADAGKVLCIGQNYADHAAELGNPVPAKPEVFVRTRTSLTGPFTPIRRPRVSEKLDYEVELALVIGTGGRYIPAAQAWRHVAGYCVFNDVSVRDYQHHGQQYTPGKNFDGTGSMGPFLVTADEIGDPSDLRLSTTVIGTDGGSDRLQEASISLLIHDIPTLIDYVSQWTTLEPGDVIATGTPSGVGSGRTPQRWLKPGEMVVCAIDKIGELRNPIVEE